MKIASVQDAVRAGIAYVPENRLVQGLILKQPVADNVVAAILEKLLTSIRLVDPKKRREKAAQWIEALHIKLSDAGVPVQTLSGGNQQRVVIAKWLAAEPRILVLDGPTVGIDVMAKSSIHAAIRELAAAGNGGAPHLGRDTRGCQQLQSNPHHAFREDPQRAAYRRRASGGCPAAWKPADRREREW